MQVCAWIGRLSINGRAQGELVAGERGRESRSPIFKFKSSLKTSTIAPHVVLVGFARRHAPKAEAARANYSSNGLSSKTLSSAGGGEAGERFCVEMQIYRMGVLFGWPPTTRLTQIAARLYEKLCDRPGDW